jgi:hypothetical protein
VTAYTVGFSSPAAKKARAQPRRPVPEAPTESDTAGAPKVCFQQELTVLIVARKSVLAYHLMACTKWRCGVHVETGCY